MKEAAGEANLTVITIILIGVVVAVGVFLVPQLMSSTAERACCTDAGGAWKDGKCFNSEGAEINTSKCVNKAEQSSNAGEAS